MTDDLQPRPTGWLRPRTTVVLLALLGVGAFLVLTEHTAHLLGVLPYLLLLACPFLHVLMHGGHSGRGGHTAGADDAHAHHRNGEPR